MTKKKILIISFLLAFCSLCYELLFSQIISIFIGSTILSYSLGIGVFVLALGVGSFLCDQLSDKAKNLSRLFYIELTLSLLGILGGYAEIILAQMTVFFPFFLRLLILFTPIAAIGLLSGMELPLLMGLKEKTQEKFYILGTDFIGMFTAALLFPLFFFGMGLFPTGIIVALINLIIAYTLLPVKKNYIKKIIVFLTGISAFLLWVFDSQLFLLRQSLFLEGVL